MPATCPGPAAPQTAHDPDESTCPECAETTHMCPPKGSGTMPCCGRTPFEVPDTDRMSVRGAIRRVARHVIASAVESQYGEMWEVYPDIGHDDWDRVCEQVERILTDTIRVPSREFDAAYGLLDLRASGRA